ncbi:MAG: SUF system Fe-S cluster assembly regulator [Rhodospirillales bacterium]|jgi:FeS assembly SUF system regulator|nr:SUF system Fe-S cluster assembly regulator [Rhodospirillales bacterium]
MIKLNKMTDYGIVVMVNLADADDTVMTAPEIASATGLTQPTVAKLLKSLVQGGLAISQRGARGGYTLARPADQISVVEALEVLDGPLSLTACVEGDHDGCDRENLCPMSGRWTRVNEAIVGALQNLTLADMISPYDFFMDEPAPDNNALTA